MQKQHLAPVFLFILVLLLSARAFIFEKDVQAPTTEPVQTNTATTTENLFDMEPLVPEAKVSTEGWKTCRNEEYGWEVKYPAEWFVYGEGSHGDGIYTEYTYETPCVGDNVVIAEWKPDTDRFTTSGRRSIRINANQESFGTYYSEYTNVRDLAQSFTKTKLVPVRFYIVNGNEAMWAETENGITLNVYHDSKRFEVTGDSKWRELLETILTTLRFLDTATSSPQ
ncbi:MAG: hypothetical protein UU98_C0002G0064 [Parcubacteria group bacterium GW2011_GWD2_42_14]|nr:MAG: hypothetical protein UU98_C0002G0064 [Parcubacteria group bacterium GW2011_GWD2_42_14]